MLNLDTHITFAVVFSFIAMVGQIVSIVAVLHTKNKEGTEKEVKTASIFTRLDTKLDYMGQRLDNVNRNVEKSDQKLDEISSKLARQDERIDNLEKRVDRLEGK